MKTELEKPILIVDLDDTVNSCAQAMVDYVNEKFGTDIKKSEINGWDFVGTRLSERLGIPESEAQVYAQEMFYKEGFFYNLKPLPGAIETVHKFYDEGWKIVFCTKPPYNPMVPDAHKNSAYIEKFLWVQNHFKNIANDVAFIGTAQKQYVRGDVLIDDSSKNIEASTGIHVTVLLDNEWNQDADPDFRVRGWDEIWNMRMFLEVEAMGRRHERNLVQIEVGMETTPIPTISKIPYVPLAERRKLQQEVITGRGIGGHDEQ